MEGQPNPYRDMPEAVRLVCARGDVVSAVRQVCDAWGLTGPQTLMTVEAALAEMLRGALESTTAALASELATTKGGDDADPEGDPGAQ